MSSYVFVICIVAIVCSTAVLRNYFKARARSVQPNAAADEAMVQLRALEERVRVLERIVTENKFDLRDEIDKL